MNGIISLGRGIEFQGTHKIGFNDRSIGIGCEGRYHSVDRVMPDAQFNALVWLVKHLRKMYGDLRIIGHNEYAATACPGQFFPLAEVQTLEFRQAEQHTPPSHIQESEEKEMTQEQFDKMMDTYLAKQRNSAVSVWAKDAWEHATELGVTDGSSPGATATREQVIVMLDRWLGLFFN
jgi:N-acetyl-anhydromuramyl-L-alanine amidase AmpD